MSFVEEEKENNFHEGCVAKQHWTTPKSLFTVTGKRERESGMFCENAEEGEINKGVGRETI